MPLPDKKLKRFKIWHIVFSILSICLAIAVIVLANVRNDILFDLLETYPGALGIDLNGDGSSDGHSLLVMVLVIEIQCDNVCFVLFDA